jgi:hypothetical protein
MLNSGTIRQGFSILPLLILKAAAITIETTSLVPGEELFEYLITLPAGLTMLLFLLFTFPVLTFPPGELSKHL